MESKNTNRDDYQGCSKGHTHLNIGRGRVEKYCLSCPWTGRAYNEIYFNSQEIQFPWN